MYRVRITGNDNSSIRFTKNTVEDVISDVERMFKLDINNDIKAVTIEPVWDKDVFNPISTIKTGVIRK